MGNIAVMWTLALRPKDIKQKAQLVDDFSSCPARRRGPSQPSFTAMRPLPGCDLNPTVTGAAISDDSSELLIGRRVTGWKRLLGRFVDGCVLSPQYLGLGAQPVVEL